MKDFVTKEKLIMYLLVALLTVGFNVIGNRVDPPRPDPFTGSDGAVMSERIKALEVENELLMNWFYTSRKNGTYYPPHNHKGKANGQN